MEGYVIGSQGALVIACCEVDDGCDGDDMVEGVWGIGTVRCLWRGLRESVGLCDCVVMTWSRVAIVIRGSLSFGF